jgi:peptidoglycan biosynthesis protein MviN/MurJ (putative lipid II flippase)
MLLGTLINVLIVIWRLRVFGLTLFLGKVNFSVFREVSHLYRPLVVAAILPTALVPINYAFAASVGVGTVAAWAFASKIVVLFVALANVGATAVVLPQLTHIFVFSRAVDIRQNANLLIALGIWFGGVLMLGGFFFADPLVANILGNDLSVAQIADLVVIVKIGLLQLPMAISGVLANKLAIASGCSSLVMRSAIFAFSGNVLVNVLLVPRIGVMGVAVGALSGVTLSTVTVLIGVYQHIGLALREMLVALISWLAWLAICLGLVSGGMAALLSAVIALSTMGWIQLRALRR